MKSNDVNINQIMAGQEIPQSSWSLLRHYEIQKGIHFVAPTKPVDDTTKLQEWQERFDAAALEHKAAIAELNLRHAEAIKGLQKHV
jgi:hypothetical protein